MMTAIDKNNTGAALPASASPRTSVARMRLDFVDGLRALAALFVVLCHAWGTIPARHDGHGTGWLYNGQLAVNFFIVISGFCLALPMVQPESFGVLRGGALVFYARRARRILPPYYFAVAVSLVLIWTLIHRHTGTLWDSAVPVTWHGFLAHLFLVQDVVDQPQINHAHWSIALEWQIYFLLPLIAAGWRKIGAAPTTALTVIVAYAAYFGATAMHPRTEFPWMLGYIALFAMGTISAVVAASPLPQWQAVRKPLPWGAAILILLAVLHEAMVKTGGLGSPLRAAIDFVMGLLSVSVLILASCPGKNYLRDALSARPLVFIGTFAYSLYLMHAPLLQVIWQYAILPLHVSWQKQMAALVFVGIPAIVATAYLFFIVCEKPWLARRPNETSRELAKDAAVSPAP